MQVLKVRHTKTTTHEAFVEVPLGLSQDEKFAHAMRETDKYDLWREVDSDESQLEIVAEYEEIPTILENK